MNANITMISYGLSGVAFLILTVMLATRWRDRVSLALMIVTTLAALWGLGLAFGSSAFSLSPFQIYFIEVVHAGAWLIFLSLLLSGSVSGNQLKFLRYGGFFLAGGTILAGVGLDIAVQMRWMVGNIGSLLVYTSILTALYALIGVEQIYRNARKFQKHGLKFLCLGIGGIFAYDLFLYSNALLFGQVGGVFWAVRGIFVAMCVVLIAIGVRRGPLRSTGIFVSRQVVFYVATLVGAGLYLTAMGILGYFIQSIGGRWVLAAQVTFFSAAFLALFVLMMSGRSRSRLRVFINKHFYKSKYDYREEWLRLISTLMTHEERMPLKKRCIQALAEVIGGRSGMLWMAIEEDRVYRCNANWNVPEKTSDFKYEHSLVSFLRKSGWIVDTREYRNDSRHYGLLDLDGVSFDPGATEIIVPLMLESSLLGFIVLAVPESRNELNYEDHDILKTAGRQIANALAQESSTEQLAEHKQFEAFNKLTAYIMHDLKNLIAQQSLVVENAQAHKENPEFVDDVIATISGSVVKMRRVIELLKASSADLAIQKVEVGKLIMQAVSSCTDRQPIPRALISEGPVWVRADPERLQMAFYHAIRNAQDATPAAGQVEVELMVNGGICTVSIVDDGCGMNMTFVREKLFRPFFSTKGTQGMGIGAYQIRETIRSMGGDVRVQSELGAGTCLLLTLQSIQPTVVPPPVEKQIVPEV